MRPLMSLVISLWVPPQTFLWMSVLPGLVSMKRHPTHHWMSMETFSFRVLLMHPLKHLEPYVFPVVLVSSGMYTRPDSLVMVHSLKISPLILNRLQRMEMSPRIPSSSQMQVPHWSPQDMLVSRTLHPYTT